MKSKWIFFIAIFCCGTTINIFGQSKEITIEEFYKPYRIALSKKRENTYRFTSLEKFYKEGELSGTVEITDEFISPDKQRYIKVDKNNDQVKKTELIKIGENYYCRRDGGGWKQSPTWCAGGGISGLPNELSSNYSVEETKFNARKALLYQQYITYKNTSSLEKDKEGLSYFQTKFWLDDNGFLLRREEKSGLLEPKRIYSEQVDSYEYNPKNLKIEAPIK